MKICILTNKLSITVAASAAAVLLLTSCLGAGGLEASPNPLAPAPSINPSPTPSGNLVAKSYARLFTSGHSLMDNPFIDYIEDIASKKADDFNYNQQIGIGSPIRVRTKGNDSNAAGWPGYSSGKNRNSNNLNIINELLMPQTLGPTEQYDSMVITERHDLLSVIQWENTIGYVRHFQDRFIAGNPQGQSYLYHAWLEVDKADPSIWIDHEKKALVAWECVASKVNHTLASDSRTDRMKIVPAGAALVDLVEKALAGQVTGLTGTTTDRLNMIFSDNVHLTNLGMYYVSLVTYATVFGKTPVGVTPPASSGIAAATATSLQQIAWDFVNSYYAQTNPGVRTMAECRSHISQNVCSSFHTLRGTTNQIASCQNYFGDSNANAVFRWPDVNYVPLPPP